ncbi:MAG: hypothetical protein F6K58_17795 [Symploca sp. SIO2E9]|nr:hypothetical protein [Symploca sp. SIO2E9]
MLYSRRLSLFLGFSLLTLPVVSVNKAHSQTLEEHMLKDAEGGNESSRDLGKYKISLTNLKISVEKLGSNIFSQKNSDSEETKFEFELNNSHNLEIEEVPQLNDFQELDETSLAVSYRVLELLNSSPADDQFPELAPGPPLEVPESLTIFDGATASPLTSVSLPPIISFLVSFPDKTEVPEFIPWDISEAFSGEATERIPEASISPLIWVGVVAIGWLYGRFNSKK